MRWKQLPLTAGFVKVPLLISGDATDRSKLLMPIYFLNKEAKINL